MILTDLLSLSLPTIIISYKRSTWAKLHTEKVSPKQLKILGLSVCWYRLQTSLQAQQPWKKKQMKRLGDAQKERPLRTQMQLFCHWSSEHGVLICSLSGPCLFSFPYQLSWVQNSGYHRWQHRNHFLKRVLPEHDNWIDLRTREFMKRILIITRFPR